MPVPGGVQAIRTSALEGYVRAQWLSAELGGGRVEVAATARRVMFRDPMVRPDWMYPGRHDQEAWEATASYVAASQRLGRPCLLVVDDARDRTREDRHVRTLGLQPSGTARCMVLFDPTVIGVRDVAGIHLEVVGDHESRQALVAASASIFEAPVELFDILYPSAMLGSDAIQAVTARLDGEVVGVAAAFMTDGAVGVYGVATALRHRRRGIGEMLTSWAVNAGVRLGARFAYLQPSDLGQPLYARMGFRDVGGYRKYLHRPT